MIAVGQSQKVLIMKPARKSPTLRQMKIDGEYKLYIITCSLRYQKVRPT